MGCMYKESHSQKLLSKGKNLNTVIFSVGFVILVTIVTSVLSDLSQSVASASSFIILIACAGLSFYVINNCIAKYDYILIDNELVIKKCIGQRSSVVLTGNLKNLDYFVARENFKEKDIKPKKLYVDGHEENIYIGAFTKDNKKIYFAFKPSPRLIEKIRREIA